MENKRIYKHVVFAILSVFTLYIVLDLFNIPQKFNIPISNINTDLFGIVSSAVVALVIYFIAPPPATLRPSARTASSLTTMRMISLLPTWALVATRSR